MTGSPNSFVWYELMTTDMDAAQSFYASVIGWTAQDFGNPDLGMRYTIMQAGERGVAGIMALPEEVRAGGGRPAWLGYVGVEDVDRAAAEAGAAGGTVHREPADIPGVGRFAVIADPQGAHLILFKPQGEGLPPPPPMTPGHAGWHELYAEDWERAFDFYAGRFGWTKAEAMDMGPMGTYQLFAAGGAPIGGMMNKPAGMPMPAWLFYFNVAAIDAAVGRVRDGGGQVLNGPMQVPGGSWIVQCADPQGAMFALVAQTR